MPDGLKFPRPAPRARGGDDADFVVNTELPGAERLFERLSEKQVFERAKQEARKKPGAPALFLPERSPLSTEKYSPRDWTPSVATVEPAYVCHGRLLFDQPNFERHGWSLGVLTPFVCTASYYYDLALLPYHYWTRPLDRWDCSAGKCLPGDAVPLLWYREKLSLTGLAAQGAVVTGAFFIVP